MYAAGLLMDALDELEKSVKDLEETREAIDQWLCVNHKDKDVTENDVFLMYQTVVKVRNVTEDLKCMFTIGYSNDINRRLEVYRKVDMV